MQLFPLTSGIGSYLSDKCLDLSESDLSAAPKLYAAAFSLLSGAECRSAASYGGGGAAFRSLLVTFDGGVKPAGCEPL